MNPPIASGGGASSAKGLLASIGGFLGGPIGGLATGLLGGLFGSSQAKKRNRMQMQLAREQMQFQERMSNTQFQRAAEDLQKAGLNRILALGKPASSPTGAMAQLQDPGVAAVNSALGIRRQQQELRNLRAQERLTDQQAVREKASAAQIQSQDALQQMQTNESLQRMMNIAAQIPGTVASSDIRKLQIEGVRTEEAFYAWINGNEAEVYFRGLGAWGPMALQLLRTYVSFNRGKK